MTVLMTGATGFIGTHLRKMLLQEGHDVVVITRSPAAYESISARNQTFVSWEEDLPGWMGRADVVIHLAGENLFGQRWSESVKESIYKSRIGLTSRVVEAMKQSDPRPSLFISASAVGYYGDGGDRILDESEDRGEGFLATVCRDWELTALKAADLGIRVATPRLGLALETGGGVLANMLPFFRWYAGGPIGSGAQYLPWIHMEDLCRGLLFPIQEPDLEGAYNLCSPEPATMDQFASALGTVLNRPSLFRVPAPLVRLVLGEASQAVLGSLRTRPAKLRSYGFEFYYEDLEESLASIL
ncbi:MAG: TIGR01777 family oxidoreductase [Balneolaceae bacterium]